MSNPLHECVRGAQVPRTWTILATLCAIALTACDAVPIGRGTPDGVTRADSASVRILTDARARSILPSVTLAATSPELTIGEIAGEEPYLFSQIAGAVQLPGGEVAVADGHTRELRIFDAGGRHLRTFGGQGEGPGELGRLTALDLLPPDTLVVWDASRYRLTFYSPDGRVLATMTRPESQGNWPPEARALSSERTVLMAHRVDPQRQSDPGIYPRADSIVVLIGTEEGIADTIGRFPGIDRAFVRRQLAPGAILVDNPPVPFGHETFVRALGDRVLVARSDGWELRVLNAAGELEEIRRFPGLERERTPEATELAAERFVAESSFPNPRGLFDDLLDRFPPPQHLPSFSDIRTTVDGSVWLAEHPAEQGADPAWWVLDPEGHLLGRIEVPADLELHFAADGVVLGVVTDEWGIERVQRYRFERD